MPQPDCTKKPPPRQPSLEFLEKWGNEIQAGQAALERRRAEYAFNHPEIIRSIAPLSRSGSNELQSVAFSSTDVRAGARQRSDLFPEEIKIWSMVILSADKGNNAGAARIWFVARALDPDGSGKVRRDRLYEYLDHLGVNPRTRRRWVAAALDLGLFRENKYKDGGLVYLMASLGRGASILGCRQMGRPAKVTGFHLVDKGWKAHVWSGFLVTLHERPISQEKRAEITGVDPRTQRNYQSEIPGHAIQNYSRISVKSEDIQGVNECTDKHVFEDENGQVIQRLPDIRIVPLFVARSSPKGRSRKAQRTLNDSLSIGRQVQSASVRLFCETPKELKAILRRLRNEDQIPPWEYPGELFELQKAGLRGNSWATIPLEAS